MNLISKHARGKSWLAALTLAGAATQVVTVAAAEETTKVTAINHDLSTLSEKQQAQIMTGLPMLDKLDCGDTVHLVFKKNGDVVVSDKPTRPKAAKNQPKLLSKNQQKHKQQLPKTP